MLTTLIIDDESHIRATLSRLLEKYCPEVKVAGEANGVKNGVEAIKRFNPDLVLLDIQMDDGSGFDLLNAIENIDFKVIFITAHEKYAVRAFKYSAVDFLLKPVNPLELAEAVVRVTEVQQSEYNTRLKALEHNFKPGDEASRKIIIKTLENIYLTDIDDIFYCESDGSYTRLHTIEEEIMVSKPLKEYDELLKDDGFYRVHKSYLINLRHIKRFEKQEGGFVILGNDHKIPVASRKKEELLEMFERLAR
jgi:two-component system LytT family response regulator